MRDQHLERGLPRGQAAPRLARCSVRRLCASRVDGDLIADAELLVSELAANALFHGRGEITLSATLDEDRLRVEVSDEGTGFERDLRRRGIDEIGGWGLELVEVVSSRWGVYEGTSHVWFELELPGPRLGEPEHPPDG